MVQRGCEKQGDMVLVIPNCIHPRSTPIVVVLQVNPLGLVSRKNTTVSKGFSAFGTTPFSTPPFVDTNASALPLSERAGNPDDRGDGPSKTDIEQQNQQAPYSQAGGRLVSAGINAGMKRRNRQRSIRKRRSSPLSKQAPDILAGNVIPMQLV